MLRQACIKIVRGLMRKSGTAHVAVARSLRGARDMGTLSHVGEGALPRMVDISGKQRSARRAVAQASVFLPREPWHAYRDEGRQPINATCILAGVMAAKRTASIIPLCHPVAIDGCDIQVIAAEDAHGGVVTITATATTTAGTGVEMEALVAASTAALTLYDMVKAAGEGVEVRRVHLVSKTGGKTGQPPTRAS